MSRLVHVLLAFVIFVGFVFLLDKSTRSEISSGVIKDKQNETEVYMQTKSVYPNFLTVNTPLVSIKVCVPNTDKCQIIDDVMLDTGSYGLYLFSSKVQGSLSVDLPNYYHNNNKLYQCSVFGSEYHQTTLHVADVYLANKKIYSGAPIGVFGENENLIKSVCANANEKIKKLGSVNGDSVITSTDKIQAMGVNGIIGLSLSNNGDLLDYYKCENNNCILEMSKNVPEMNINSYSLSMPKITNVDDADSTVGKLILDVAKPKNNANCLHAYTDDDFAINYIPATVGKHKIKMYFDTGTNANSIDVPTMDYLGVDINPFNGYLMTNKEIKVSVGLKDSKNLNIALNDYEYLRKTWKGHVIPSLSGVTTIHGVMFLGMPFFYGKTVSFHKNDSGADICFLEND